MNRYPKFFCLIVISVLLALPAAAQEAAQTLARDPEIVVPSGTVFPVALNTYLNTKSTQVGDVFYADTTYPIWIQQRLVIPRGSIIKGTVTAVNKPGAIKGRGNIAIRFDSILLPNGVERAVVANLQGIHGPGAEKIDRQTETVEQGSASDRGAELGTVVGTASQGAIIGAVTARSGAGAGIGAGAGALTGAAIMLLSRKRDLLLEPGIQLDLQLAQPLRFAYAEIDFRDDEISRAARASAVQPRKTQTARPSILSRLPFPRIWR